MDIAEFLETNEDIFFLLYNSFNELLVALEKSSNLYVEELFDRSTQKREDNMILFILSIPALFLSLWILVPVVSSVNKRKFKVLSLFCEIDNNNIRYLSNKCERFITNLQAVSKLPVIP
jgi:hypothetical protein